MSRLKLYAIIYVVLFVLATVQAAVEFVGLLDAMYATAFAVIAVLSFAKAFVVAGYYQHLRWEPRSLSTLMALGTLGALTLTVAASYSIL